ncbi:hypothetical protein ACVI1K_003512 [Bradyrhizobium sp. USDA 4508]
MIRTISNDLRKRAVAAVAKGQPNECSNYFENDEYASIKTRKALESIFAEA